jgi:UDP-GlcNAc3NAcA epimerase
MPEEINRILSDNVSTLLFTPTQAGYDNLIHEGFSSNLSDKPTFNCPNIYHCGDIMYDNTLFFYKYAINKIDSIEKYGMDFILCTIHRNTNTDDKDRLTNIFSALEEISKDNKIILPLHPRTRKMMPLMLGESFVKRLEKNNNIKIIEPVSFLDMIYLEAKSKLVITDSGGVQKEAYYLKKPSIILRPQTEWVEIVNTGNAIVADADKDKIISSTKLFLKNPPKTFPQIFGDGKAAEFICQKIIETIK